MTYFTLIGRAGEKRRDSASAAPTTFDTLRQMYQATGEMDTEDLFGLGEADKAAPVKREDEKTKAVENGSTVTIVAVRAAIAFTDAKGEVHSLFVFSDETVAGFRKAHTDLIKDSDELIGDGKKIDKADESKKFVRSIKQVKVSVPAPPPEAPQPLKLLLFNDDGKPQAMAWAGGKLELPLADLRAFLKTQLKDKTPTALFLDSSSAPVPEEMEPFETVGKLGAVDSLKQLRVRFQQPKKAGAAAGTTSSTSGAASTPSTSAASPGAGTAGAATPILRDTRDTLAATFGRAAVPPGAPRDVFDRMEPPDQATLLASMRYLHGLRFVPTSQKSYELERSVRPALDASHQNAFVRVVRPMTSTRFSASAAENRTLDSVASSLSWNVGGSVGVDAKADSLSVKADYKEGRDTSRETAEAELHLRVEFLVARGEIAVDPRGVILAPELLADLQSAIAAKGDSEKSRGIARILDTYGTHLPLRTLFGGKLIYRQDRELKDTTKKETMGRDFSADVQGTYQAVTATARGGFKSSDASANRWESNKQAIEVTASGGDPALALDPYGWAATLSHAGWWSPIAFADIVPLLSVLPDDLLEKVEPMLTAEIGSMVNSPVDWGKYKTQITNYRLKTINAARDSSDSFTAGPGTSAAAKPAQPSPAIVALKEDEFGV
jgi:hypothetical protein